METNPLRRGPLDQSVSPHKSQIGNPNKIFHAAGLLKTPPLLYHPYPTYTLQQPPLLPLPAAALRGAKKSKSRKKAAERAMGSQKTGHLGPNPKDLPATVSVEVENRVDVFSGFAMIDISPPPGSLPFPNFSLRQKLSCRAEVSSGIDVGATDDLRRLLRLR